VLDGGDAVDMAEDVVAAHERIGADGVLEVDAITGAERDEGGLGEGFGDGIEVPRVAGGGVIGDGEAAAADGDGIAAGGEVGPVDGRD